MIRQILLLLLTVLATFLVAEYNALTKKSQRKKGGFSHRKTGNQSESCLRQLISLCLYSGSRGWWRNAQVWPNVSWSSWVYSQEAACDEEKLIFSPLSPLCADLYNPWQLLLKCISQVLLDLIQLTTEVHHLKSSCSLSFWCRKKAGARCCHLILN